MDITCYSICICIDGVYDGHVNIYTYRSMSVYLNMKDDLYVWTNMLMISGYCNILRTVSHRLLLNIHVVDIT